MTLFNVKQKGFSLVEMAMVLIILAMVIGMLLLPVTAQRDHIKQTETENTLETAKRALLGFAQQNGRLPCPATAASNGVAQATCNTVASATGFLPAATLGIQPVDSSGFAIDGWYVENSLGLYRIRYAVTIASAPTATCGGTISPDFTTASEMATVGMACLAPDLRVCASATATDCTATRNLINNAVAVIYSTGETGFAGSGGADEDTNLNAGTIFVSHTPTPAGSTNGEFDHVVTWISPFVLYNAMIEAGQLH